MLQFSNKTEGNTVYVKVKGRVDSTNAPIFEKTLDESDTAERLVIDVEGLEYVSSAGLRVILKMRKKHADLEIQNASTEVYEIFDMTGFTDMMTVKRAYRTVSVDGAEVIGKGANGLVYRIDPDTVVKVYLNADSLSEIEHERDVARKALVLGIPTAISYDMVKVGGHYASMFEMLNARSFSELISEHPENVDKFAVKYVELLKQIHSTKAPKGQFFDSMTVLQSWLKDIDGQLPEDKYSKLLGLCETVPHTDF